MREQKRTLIGSGILSLAEHPLGMVRYRIDCAWEEQGVRTDITLTHTMNLKSLIGQELTLRLKDGRSVPVLCLEENRFRIQGAFACE